MSAAADRICHWCRIPDRGVYGECGDGRLICGPCFASMNAVPAMSTDADRNDVCAVCDNTRWRHPDQSVFVPDAPIADRIAALEAELGEARRERANAQAAEAHAINAKVIACTKRDAALAETAAMRQRIEYYVDYPDSRCDSGDNGSCVTVQQLRASIGTAGRALAARVPLLEAVLEWARKLSAQNKTKRQHARASQTEIELAKAVAALDEKGPTE